MKIVIATPLFPPDIADPAPYVKELAKRLAAHHSVIVICYGSMPESVPNVRFITIRKNFPAVVRIALFTFALIRNAIKADIVYAQDGASVEVPLMLANYVIRTPFIFRIDSTPTPLKDSGIRYSARNSLLVQASSVLEHIALVKPEIHPLEPRPDAELMRYEAAWQSHLDTLEALFRKIHG